MCIFILFAEESAERVAGHGNVLHLFCGHKTGNELSIARDLACHAVDRFIPVGRVEILAHPRRQISAKAAQAQGAQRIQDVFQESPQGQESRPRSVQARHAKQAWGRARASAH